jgi:hypothetical protein
MPLLEIDAFRAAKMLIDRHGAEAAGVAEKTVKEAAQQGDIEKQTAWQMILRAVEELQRHGPKEGERVN